MLRLRQREGDGPGHPAVLDSCTATWLSCSASEACGAKATSKSPAQLASIQKSSYIPSLRAGQVVDGCSSSSHLVVGGVSALRTTCRDANLCNRLCRMLTNRCEICCEIFASCQAGLLRNECPVTPQACFKPGFCRLRVKTPKAERTWSRRNMAPALCTVLFCGGPLHLAGCGSNRRL